MQTQQRLFARAACAAGALLLALPAQAQSAGDLNVPPTVVRQQMEEIARGDPARWFQEDLTFEARLRTIQKEIAAGLQENLGACRARPTVERPACMQEARVIHRQELAGARARAMSSQ